MVKLSKLKITLILTSLLVLIAVSGCTDLFGNFELAGEKDLISIPKSNYTGLQMEIYIRVGSIDIEVIPTATYVVDVVNRVSIREGSGGTLAEAKSVITSETDSQTMKVFFDSDDTDIRVDYKYDLFIKVGNNVSLEIYCLTATGEITCDLSDSTVDVSAFYLEATTGTITLSMSEVLMSDSSPTVKTTTGEQVVTLTNLQYAMATTWSISSTTGSLDLDLTENLPRNVTAIITHTFNLECTTGNIDVLADLLTYIGVQVNTEVTTGIIELPGGGSSFISDNFASASLKYIFNLETTTGSISFTTEG